MDRKILSKSNWRDNMERSTKLRVSILLTAVLIISMVPVQTTAAKSVTPLSEPAATDSKSIHSDSNLPKEDQKLVIDAIKASGLSDSEKKDLIKNLKDIWSNKSDLSDSEQEQVLSKAASTLYEYLGIDGSGVGILWNWEPHSDLAKTAGVKMGVPSAYWQTIYNEANTPDNWPRYLGDHFWYVSYRWGDGPSKTKQYADEARSYIKNNPSEGYKRLSWSMHYMSDLANPWHTVLLYGQVYHTTYENYVSNNWNPPGHNFNQTIQDNWYYYYITDPKASAKNLAAVSNQYINFLVGKIGSDPNWQNNPTVISDTRVVLTHGIRYDMGLVNYATR